MMRKGWFKIPGVQDGDRTLEQQIKGLEDLDVVGHTVLELGCAEGLMSRWLVSRRGASGVVGYDVVIDHVREARWQCKDLPTVSFWVQDLNREPRALPEVDTVIALAVLHKLRDPSRVADMIAQAASRQIVLRLPPETAPVINDKRSGNRAYNVELPLLMHGWKRERVTEGSFGEWTAFYAR